MHDGPAQSLTNIAAAGPDRGAAPGPRSQPQARTEIGAARRDGPAHARRHQDVHLRCPAHGPRRPGPRAHAPPRGPGPRPPLADPHRVRVVRNGPTPADGRRERPLPDHRRDGHRLPVLPPDRISIRFEWGADKTEARIAARRARRGGDRGAGGRRSRPAQKRGKGGDARHPRGAPGHDRRDARREAESRRERQRSRCRCRPTPGARSSSERTRSASRRSSSTMGARSCSSCPVERPRHRSPGLGGECRAPPAAARPGRARASSSTV